MKTRAVILLAILGALVVSGCGSDGSSKVADPGATTAKPLTPPGESSNDNGAAATTSTE